MTVATDSIVDSTAKLIATTKTLTMARGGLKSLKQSPEGSLLRRLSTKETEEVILNDLNKMDRIRKNIDRYVVLGNDVGVVYWMTLFSKYAHDTSAAVVAFFKPIGYYEALEAYQMRRSLDEERKSFINRR